MHDLRRDIPMAWLGETERQCRHRAIVRDSLEGSPSRCSAAREFCPLALCTERKLSADDKRQGLGSPFPDRSESTPTENAGSPSDAEPAHNDLGLRQCRKAADVRHSAHNMPLNAISAWVERPRAADSSTLNAFLSILQSCL